MIRTGLEARCDRCGERKFYTSDGPVSGKTLLEADGWEHRQDKLLCIDCVALFDGMAEQFFNEIWDK